MRFNSYLLVTLMLISQGSALAQDETPILDDEASIAEDLVRQAEEIKHKIIIGKPQFSMVGPLVARSGNTYSVNNESFKINETTDVVGTLKVGAAVEVRGYLERGKPKIARQVIVQQQIETTGNQKDETPNNLRAESARLR